MIKIRVENNDLIIYPEGTTATLKPGPLSMYGEFDIHNFYTTVRFEPGVKVERKLVHTFEDIKADTIDFTNLECIDLKEFNGVFYHTTVNHINWGSLDLSNVENMIGTFAIGSFDILDLSGLNLNKVYNISNCFTNTLAYKVILPGLNNVNIALETFSICQIKVLQLPKNSFQYLGQAENMFSQAKINELVMDDIYFNDLVNAATMFERAQITNLDISKFHFNNRTSFEGMFDGVEIDKIVLNVEYKYVKHKLDLYGMFINSKINYLDLTALDKYFNQADVKYIFKDAQINTLVLTTKQHEYLIKQDSFIEDLLF